MSSKRKSLIKSFSERKGELLHAKNNKQLDVKIIYAHSDKYAHYFGIMTNIITAINDKTNINNQIFQNTTTNQNTEFKQYILSCSTKFTNRAQHIQENELIGNFIIELYEPTQTLTFFIKY